MDEDEEEEGAGMGGAEAMETGERSCVTPAAMSDDRTRKDRMKAIHLQRGEPFIRGPRSAFNKNNEYLCKEIVDTPSERNLATDSQIQRGFLLT